MVQYLILCTKVPEGKASVPYVKIIWDGAQTPVTHAQSRICLEKDLTAVTIDYFNARD
jgi:hypothetical protein